MKKIITPIGAIIVLLFTSATWLVYNGHIAVSLYTMAGAAPILTYLIFAMVVIAFVLIVLPIFLKNPIRPIAVAVLSLLSIALLLAFREYKYLAGGEMGVVELSTAWYGVMAGFLIAFLGGFVGGKKKQAEVQSST